MPSLMRPISRRTMLGRSLRAATVLAGWNRVMPLLASPDSRWFKIGACDWSLDKRADPAAFDIAQQIGLDGVQVSMGTVDNNMHLRSAETQSVYLDMARRTGIEIASLAITEMNQVPLKSDPRAVRWLDESIDVCRALGLSLVMLPFFNAGELDMNNLAEIDRVIGVLKDAAPKAERHGVVIGLENYLSADDNLRIVDRVASPVVKVYYDVGNSTDKGRDIAEEIRSLGSLICGLHAKDGSFMLGQGRIDFKQVRKALDDIQYRGWVQIEAAAPHVLIADYTTHCKYLRNIFPRQVN